MTIKMNDSHIVSIAQIKAFSKLNSGIRFKTVSKNEKYQWINDALTKFRYFKLKKKEKGIVRDYIKKMTGLSQSQTTRIIAKKKKLGRVFLSSTNKHRFPRKYAPTDIALLVKTDNSHSRLSGPATKRILEREHKLFNNSEYSKISEISCSHIYNLRKTRQYQSHSLTVKGTRAISVSIGKRKKPEPEGKPGFLRIDTVHQGDLNKKKGLYHINIVDEVLQWEIVGAVEKISERYLKPLLEDLLAQFPYVIRAFHSDNGSEFINKVIAELLNKLLIEQTKSRSRHCNDNALVESKNGSAVRKYIGHRYIPQSHAPAINQFYKELFNIYLNYHRPCGFATTIIDKKGKERKVYRQEDYQTPYEKLKSLNKAEQYLKPDITFADLDKIAYEKSDNEFAEIMQKAKDELFKNLKTMPQGMMIYTGFVKAVSCSYVD